MSIQVIKGGGALGGLQLATNALMTSNLTSVTDRNNTASPLKLSTTNGLFGTAYTAGQFVNTNFVFNNYSGVGDETANIAVFGASQATLNDATKYGYGIYGHGYTNGSARSGGVVGEGMVTNSSDSGSSIGVRGYALQTHSGGLNIGLYGNASGGSSNYALWLESGDIQQTLDAVWKVAVGKGLNFNAALNTALSGSFSNFTFSAGAINPASSGSASYKMLSNTYTIAGNGTQTGTVTGIFLNATETALAGFTHNLMDLQVGGVSKFKVLNSGTILNSGDILSGAAVYAFTASAGAGMLRGADLGCYLRFSINGAVANNACFLGGTSTFNLLQLGGTTSSFPAIKRNGAAIDFRLADDSGYALIRANALSQIGSFDASGAGLPQVLQITSSGANAASIALYASGAGNAGFDFYRNGSFKFNVGVDSGNNFSWYNAAFGSYSFVIQGDTTGRITFGSSTGSASAQVSIDSTARGFLPPRMTTTQKNAISSPAAGLVVYDTTLNKLAVYTTAWETVTSI